MAHPLAAAVLSLALAVAPSALAQPSITVEGGEIRALQAKARTPQEKKALVAQTLELTDAEAKRFWPVYDAYQRRVEATNRRYALAIQEAVMPERVSDRHARDLARELNEIEDAESRARRTMHSAVVKALPGRKAIRYIQLENKLQSGYRFEVASALPLVK
jgi:Spy/CpxP family protein refolding chaperone